MAREYCHRCGHPIWHDSRWDGVGYVPIFSDADERSWTYGQEVTHCPRCGDELRPDVVGRILPEHETAKRGESHLVRLDRGTTLPCSVTVGDSGGRCKRPATSAMAHYIGAGRWELYPLCASCVDRLRQAEPSLQEEPTLTEAE